MVKATDRRGGIRLIISKSGQPLRIWKHGRRDEETRRLNLTYHFSTLGRADDLI